MLPISDTQDVDIACSQATLVRIEKAKQHFELFSKYLELLSYLPPLQHSPYSVQSTSGRAYNPLQSIRNRKIRVREKNSSTTDSEEWQDVSRVEKWLSSVEAAHQKNSNDPYQCVALPPFDGHREGGSVEQQESWQTTSPPSSVRGLNRSGTTKVHRRRLDWAITPAELFADTVWVESGSNKLKICDREGGKLYPDSSKLKFTGSRPSIEGLEPPRQSETIPTEQSVNLPSFTTTKHDGRESHEHLAKVSNGHATPRSHVGYAPKWTRSSSISGDSSSDDMVPRGRTRRISRKAKMKAETVLQAEKLHRVLHGHSDSSNAASKRSKPISHPSSVKADVDKSQMLISPAGSVTGKEERRMSLDEMDSTAPNSPAQGPIFPSITVNLSPPSSRSPSPQKRFPRIMETLHEKAKPRRHIHTEEGLDGSPSGDSNLRKRPTVDSSPKDNVSPRALEPSFMPETPLGHDDMLLDDFRRSDTHGSFKPYGSHESRLKGFLKNSRIAEIVGSEVSKVGDMIRRKDGGGHSRQSSYASSIVSDLHDSDEERSEGESTPSKRNSLRRGSTFSDEEIGLPWRKPNGRTKTFLSNLPTIGPSFRINDQEGPYYQQPESSRVSDVHFVRAHPDLAPSSVDATPYSERRGSYGFIPPSSKDLNSKLHKHDDEVTTNAALPGIGRSVRPPVTGLANAEASTTTNRHHRPTATTGSHGWSLSDRSVPTLSDTTLLQKREILRCQALLLSSGVKASEIVQRYEKPRDPSLTPPPRFLIRSLVDAQAPIPHSLPRIDEFNYAARNLLERLENTKTGLNKSMYLFTKSTLLPLEKEIATLEDFISNHLTPRVRTAALEAEALSTRLNTTSTLEIKQLSDTLDKGLRKRNRRLRSIRRIGFSLLEWTLVGVMWWLWLIVMVFKVIRGVGKGVVKGVRWILWL
ncbi:uncharacterized protein BHQ10_003030 [Talaromyces amestolkiae]|uniref:Uncharacterized protein n=1 Tax=Talaromyces amestolkiae TaxID=1196081 RepID=A0A364KTZ0_TALAM|nr:uncharacterized protein BHQ10_003030 [Talaromyces amestolkiae]RAO67018.1 hypothetical protein BHQ10_003030 [Talaromyces amestolkiae]